MSFLKAIWKGNSKHKKLCEEWALTNSQDCKSTEPPPDGVTFLVKYLGSTLVETPSNEAATADAIKTIITMAKASGKKLPRVALSVNLSGIKVVDLASDDIHLEVSIYRISYCSADASHNHVFAFIATNANETMECHAYLCPKRKMAQAVTLTVAHSFNTVYELWQMSEQSQSSSGLSDPTKNDSEKFSGFCSKLNESAKQNSIHESKSLLIDFNTDEPETNTFRDNGNTWVCFDNDDDKTDNFNKSFSNKKFEAISTPRPQQHLQVIASQNNGTSGNVWGDMTTLL